MPPDFWVELSQGRLPSGSVPRRNGLSHCSPSSKSRLTVTRLRRCRQRPITKINEQAATDRGALDCDDDHACSARGGTRYVTEVGRSGSK